MTAHEEVYLVVETFGRVPNSLRRTKASGVRAKRKKTPESDVVNRLGEIPNCG